MNAEAWTTIGVAIGTYVIIVSWALIKTYFEQCRLKEEISILKESLIHMSKTLVEIKEALTTHLTRLTVIETKCEERHSGE